MLCVDSNGGEDESIHKNIELVADVTPGREPQIFESSRGGAE